MVGLGDRSSSGTKPQDGALVVGRQDGARPDPLAPFWTVVAPRFVGDPDLWASALLDEVAAPGYDRSM